MAEIVRTDDFLNPKWRGIKPAVCAFIRHGDNIVGVFSKKRGYKPTLPGGSLDEGETIFDAAHREMWEETGLDLPLECADFAVVHTGSDGETYFTHVFYHTFSVTEPRPEVTLRNEKEYAEWTTLEALQRGPYADVYNAEFTGLIGQHLLRHRIASLPFPLPNLLDVIPQIDHIFSGEDATLVQLYMAGVPPTKLREMYPEKAIPDLSSDPAAVVMKLQKEIEKLRGENAQLRAKVPQAQGIGPWEAFFTSLTEDDRKTLDGIDRLDADAMRERWASLFQEFVAKRTRVIEYESGEEAKRVLDLYRDEAKEAEALREVLRGIFDRVLVARFGHTGIPSRRALRLTIDEDSFTKLLRDNKQYVAGFLGMFEGAADPGWSDNVERET